MKHLYPKLTAAAILLAVSLFLSINFSSATVISKTNTANTTLNTGLVGWWTFDGTTVTSVSTTDRTGITGSGDKRGGVTVGTGKIGQALKLDGTDDAVYIPNTSSLSFVTTTSFTLSAWVKTAKDVERIIAHYEGSPYWVIAIGSDCTANKACFAIRGAGGGEPIAKSTSNVTDNKWHLITGVRNVATDQTYLYFDGVKEATTADSSIGAFGNGYGPFLGCHQSGNTCVSQFFNGLIDDARIYNRALSSAEVLALYKQGGGKISKTDTTKPTLKTGLVGWWTMDGKDVTANTTTDRSGYGNDGKRWGGTFVTTGKIGQAIRLNGTSGSVTTTLNGFPDATSDVTVSFWAKLQNSISNEGTFLSASPDEQTNRFGIHFPYINNIYWDFGDINATGRLQMSMNAGWYQTMAFWTFTSQTGVGQKIYRNGVVVASDGDVSTFTKGTKSPVIGGFSVGSPTWKGILDDLRIYSRALSTVEIQQLYTQGGGKINKTDLIRAQLRSGLNIHLPLDGKDVNSVTTTNRSGNSFDCTRTGAPTAVGRIGQALKFGGIAGDVILCNDNPLAEPSTALTASVWLKRIGGVGSRQIFLGKGDGALNATTQYWVEIEAANNLAFLLETGTGTNNTLTATDLKITDVNTWHLVTATWGDNLMKLYLDGRASSVTVTTTGTLNDTSNHLGFGRLGDLAGTYYNGRMDDIRLYNRALTPAEVVELYRMGK